MLIVKNISLRIRVGCIVLTVENLLSHQLIKDWLSFHARIQFYCRKQKRKLLYLKDIDMSISPLVKFLILTDDVAKLTKIIMGRRQILLSLYGSLNIFFNVFAADLNLRKNVFQIDMPPSFLLWRIGLLEIHVARSQTNKFLSQRQNFHSSFPIRAKSSSL